MKIIAFGASSSQQSINKQFAHYVAQQFENATIELLDLNDYEMPIFSVDKEKNGFPELARDFVKKLGSADLLVISLAEHNGSYTAAFKNIMDWATRVKLKIFDDKKTFLLSTSSGARGGKSVMEAALTRFPIHGAAIVASFSLPKYDEYFDINNGILEEELKQKFEEAIEKVKQTLNTPVLA